MAQVGRMRIPLVGAAFGRALLSLFSPEPLRVVDDRHAGHQTLNVALHDRPRAAWLGRTGLMNIATSPRQLQPG